MFFARRSSLSIGLHAPDALEGGEWRVDAAGSDKSRLPAAQSSGTTSLLPRLFGLLSDPVGTVTNLSGRVWDELASDEKKSAWRLKERKQTLYAKLTDVSFVACFSIFEAEHGRR